MFREMRRSGQQLPGEECEAILCRGTSGVLAVLGDGGYPYAVPLSYVYEKGKLYFHCARTGHKLDAIAKEERVSFCVIDQDQVVPEEYTTYFRSVVVFGRARCLEDEAEKRRAIELLAAKYTPDDPQGRAQEIEEGFGRMCMVEIRIEHMSGKEARELAKCRKMIHG